MYFSLLDLSFDNRQTHCAHVRAQLIRILPLLDNRCARAYIFGKNIKLEVGKKIIQEWKTTEWPDYPPSILEYSFENKDNGTELSMVHSNVPAEQSESYRQGWIDFYWEPLKNYFENIH